MTTKEVGEYKYLITGMDYFSKNLEMRPLKSKSATEVAQFIYEDIIYRWGSPDVIITDQGCEFCNAINDELMECAHCKHRITRSYHPQSNGLVERQDRTTTNFLLKNMDCQDDWVDMIPTMMGSHRHTVHSTTNIEPSAILLGCKPTLSTDMLLRSDDYLNRELQDEEIKEIENRNYTEILKQLNLVRESVFNTTSQNISTAQVSHFPEHIDGLSITEKILRYSTLKKLQIGKKRHRNKIFAQKFTKKGWKIGRQIFRTLCY